MLKKLIVREQILYVGTKFKNTSFKESMSWRRKPRHQKVMPRFACCLATSMEWENCFFRAIVVTDNHKSRSRFWCDVFLNIVSINWTLAIFYRNQLPLFPKRHLIEWANEIGARKRTAKDASSFISFLVKIRRIVINLWTRITSRTQSLTHMAEPPKPKILSEF